MESLKNIKKLLAAVLLFSEGFNLLPSIDPTAELLQAAEKAELKVQGFVVSGWIKLPNKQSLKAAEQLLHCRIGVGNNVLPWGNDELKITVSTAKKPSISLQLITKDAELAESCRSFWQKFADIWGGGEIIGITVLAQAYEEMSAADRSRLCRQIGGGLKGQGEIHQSAQMTEAVYFAPKMGRSLNVAQRRINFNIVIRSCGKQNSVYLAAPLIYQTY